MIGALLMSLCLAIIFLTRPNKKRNTFIKNLTFKLSLHHNKKSGIIGDEALMENERIGHIKQVTIVPSHVIDQKSQDNLIIKDNEVFKSSIEGQFDMQQLDSFIIEDSEPLKDIYVPSINLISIQQTQNLDEHLVNNGIANIIQSLKEHPEQVIPFIKDSTHAVSFKSQQTKQIISKDLSDLSNLIKVKTELLSMPTNLQKEVKIVTIEDNMNDSIIDIDDSSQPIDYSNIPADDAMVAPSWSHFYIYGYSDLEKASPEQSNFYDKFKVKFLTGKWVDLAGNTNYAFILLFDLLKQFNVHKNISVLEEQMNSISTFYPKTSSYAKRFLLAKMRDIGDKEGLDRLEWTIVNHNRNEYQPWDWRVKYVEKLKLNETDAKLLDEIWISHNNFMNIDFCAVEVVKFYIGVIKAIKKAHSDKGLQHQEQLNIILDLIARKQYRYHLNSSNYKYVMSQNKLVNNLILKFCEQTIRNIYKFNRKISDMDTLDPAIAIAVNDYLLNHIEDYLPELITQVSPIDDETDMALYGLISTRWKSKLDLSETHYQHIGKEKFLQEVTKMLKLNQNNLSLENIYLDVFKFLLTYDKQLALENFLLYTHQNLVSKKHVLKPMSQSMTKKMFPNLELLERYYKIHTALVKRESSIIDLIKEIKDFYLPQRKKIVLNTQVIKQVEQQYSGTVEILNEYLKDDDTTEPINNAITKTQILPVEGQYYKFSTNQNEETLISLFVENNYKVTIDQMNLLCKSLGVNKGALINNINENSYDIIDDLLIETEDANYSMNINYYNQIIKV